MSLARYWAVVTGGAGVGSKFGFGRGFDTYLDDKPFAGFEYSIPPALEWIGKNRDARFFMFLHGYDSHGQHPVEGNPRDAMPDYKGTLDGGIEEQARLREEGFANVKTPGQPPNLTTEFIKGRCTSRVHSRQEGQIPSQVCRWDHVSGRCH